MCNASAQSTHIRQQGGQHDRPVRAAQTTQQAHSFCKSVTSQAELNGCTRDLVTNSAYIASTYQCTQRAVAPRLGTAGATVRRPFAVTTNAHLLEHRRRASLQSVFSG